MTDIPIFMQAPQYPEELKDWEELDKDQFRVPWQHFSEFLDAHGYIIPGHPQYHREPKDETSPIRSAKEPFHPQDDEAFVHGERSYTRKVDNSGYRHYLQTLATDHVVLDFQRRNIHIKVVPHDDPEIPILRYLSTGLLRADPRNHTIPHVKLLLAGDWTFILRPHWGMAWQHTPFENRLTRLEVARQLIEGLDFMHESGVGHGNIYPGNIVWNHNQFRPGLGRLALYPPSQITFDFRFAYIGFDSSRQFQPNATSHEISSQPMPPDWIAAPEQIIADEVITYDIYSADVYCLGRTLKCELDQAMEYYQGQSNTESGMPEGFAGLLSEMMDDDPKKRPTARKALEVISQIIAAESETHLNWKRV